jgi:hypothetical protein
MYISLYHVTYDIYTLKKWPSPNTKLDIQGKKLMGKLLHYLY